MNEDIDARHVYRFTYNPHNRPTLVLDNASGTIHVDKSPLHLEPLAFNLLSILLVRAGQLVSRDDLLVFLKRSEQDGHHSGGMVLNNTVSYLRRQLRKAYGDYVAELIKTGKGGYFFNGAVTIEAQTGMDIEDRPLKAGDHIATARATLSERLGANAGIEEWLGQTSDTPPSPCRVRIAVTENGARRLRHERDAYAHIISSTGQNDIVLSPRANLRLPKHQVLSWNWPPFSLDHEDRNTHFLSKFNLKHRLDLFLSVARKLASLHETGTIHGDIKASQVFLISRKTEGRGFNFDVRLAGLAHSYIDPKLTNETDGLNLQNLSWRFRRADSTPYCAPELQEGASISIVTDVYALGVLLFKIVAGRIDLPFGANWQDEIDCRVLRADIALATARDPSKRPRSVADLIETLKTYEDRRAKAHSEDMALLKAQTLRKRRPLYLAALCTLFITAASLGFTALSLNAANQRVQKEAASASMARDALRSILLSADPRATDGAGDETVDELLKRASEKAGDATDDFDELATFHLILSEAYRGRGNIEGERDELESALIALWHLPPGERRALVQYGLATNLLISGGESSKENQTEALELIEEANTIFDSLSEPSPELRAAQAYALGMVQSQSGDFQEALDGLLPWLEIVQKEGLPIDRRAHNAVVLISQAQLRTGDAERAYQTLQWLSDNVTDAIPGYINVNRLTLKAQVSSVLDRPDTDEQFNDLLDTIKGIYGDGSIPEGTALNYYANFLEGRGELQRATELQTKARAIVCEKLATKLHCEGLRMNLAGLLIKQEKYNEAAGHLDIVEPIFRDDFPKALAQVDYARGMIAMGRKEWIEAVKYFDAINVEDLEATSPSGDWETRLVSMKAVSANPDDKAKIIRVISVLEEDGIDQRTLDWMKKVTDTL